MKTEETLKAVEDAEGMTGFDLQHFGNLPKNASKKKQIEALTQDREWWELHVIEIYEVIEDAIKTVGELRKK